MEQKKGKPSKLSLELLSEKNLAAARKLQREDISEDFVDTVDTIWELTQYGLSHHCIGHTYAVNYEGRCIGLILLGEALPWETDPAEMWETPFYRLMGFVLDRSFRGQGIGGAVLEEAISLIYREFGVRPIACGVHQENHRAARFYEKHGFHRTDAMEGNDFYFLRYPGTK